MNILITKGKNRNTLCCKREDGTLTTINLGPNIPHHDIAHYVVEKKFDLDNGFYGKIKSGMAIAALSDKEVIKTLGAESWLSEIMARNLQAIGTGGTSAEQYIKLVNWELESIKDVQRPHMTIAIVEEMKTEFSQLCEAWDLISEQGTLDLTFE